MYAKHSILRLLVFLGIISLFLITGCFTKSGGGGSGGDHSGAMHIVGDSEFSKEVLRHDGYVLVDFTAHWCPPCNALSPHIDKLSTEMSDNLKVVKVYEDKVEDANNDLLSRYNIKAYPTLIIFKNGEQVETHVGGLDYNSLAKWATGVIEGS